VSKHPQNGHDAVGEPVWAKPEPGARSPRYTRQQIAEKALEIADAEGIQAVSMRRVASELGAGTMTLYHYVPNKRGLLTLMNDAITAELLVPEDEVITGWRDALTQIARRNRATLQRHLWAIGSMRDARYGPNGMRQFEQALAAVVDVPLTPSERLGLIAIVENYVLGFVISGELVPTNYDDEWLPAAADYIATQLGTGEFPHLEALLGGGDVLSALRALDKEMTPDERFENGLARILDGIALFIEAR
jgi:AcrR family transcriptional regulator